MFRTLAFCIAVAAPSGAAFAQDDQTLADIRTELSQLYGEVTALRDELVATGQSGQGVAGATPLDRLNSIEAELTRLTSKTEELEFRITRITRDGTNRIGDLEFRLCELEADCDIAALGDTPTLGGVDVAQTPAPQPPHQAPAEDGPQLAVGEQADFDRAQEVLGQGDFRRAAELFATFAETYPGGPMTAQAHLQRGVALSQLGENTQAARAYLEAFSSDQDGPAAPEALYRLGAKLGELGQTQEACVTLAEVGARFPQSDAVLSAEQARARIGCP